MLRLLLIPAVLIALLAGAMVWSGSAAERRADFTFVNRGDIGTLDPNRMSWMQEIRIGYALWEGLYTLDPKTLEAIPGCADPIEISDDKRTYTFHIRPAARWSNGDDLVAGDFIFAWRRMLQVPGDYTYLLHYIEGAKEYEDAFEKNPVSADFSRVAVTALSPKVLRVKLAHPVAFFPDICAFPPAFPLNERSMRKFLDEKSFQSSGRQNFDKEFTRPPYLVTNGAYKLTQWQFKRRLRMEANPYYWDRANVKSAVIDQVNAEDAQIAYELYRAGRVDWLSDVPGEIGAELRVRGDKDLHSFTAFGTYFYSFNCLPTFSSGRPNPFADVRVRQALSMAVDKRIIVDTITRLGEIPTTDYVPPGAFPNYHSPAGLPYDLPRARQLLADAGYPGGRNFPSVSLLFNNEGQHGAIVQNIHRQWLDALGIDLRLEGIEIKMFRERLHSKDYAVARASWFGDYNDLSTFTDKYKPDSGNNDSGWMNPQYADLCAKADVEADPAKRLRYFEQAEALLLEEAPILPVFTYVNSYMFRDNVRGIPLNPRAMQMFKAIEVIR